MSVRPIYLMNVAQRCRPLDQVNQYGLWVRLQVAIVYMSSIIAIY